MVLPLILNAISGHDCVLGDAALHGQREPDPQANGAFQCEPEVMQKAIESANTPAAVYRGYIGAAIASCVFFLFFPEP